MTDFKIAVGKTSKTTIVFRTTSQKQIMSLHSFLLLVNLSIICDLDFNDFYSVNISILCPEKNISKAFSGCQYSIYTAADDNYDNIYCAGDNQKGSCGVGKTQQQIRQLTPITYFNKHG